MTQVFQGRSFLAEKDFTRAELEYLIDFSAHLKDLKKRGVPHRYLEGKNIALLFEKHPPERGQPLQLLPLTWGLIQNIWEPMTFSWVRKNPLKILPRFWVACLMASNSGASANGWLRNWPSIQGCLYGMA